MSYPKPAVELATAGSGHEPVSYKMSHLSVFGYLMCLPYRVIGPHLQTMQRTPTQRIASILIGWRKTAQRKYQVRAVGVSSEINSANSSLGIVVRPARAFSIASGDRLCASRYTRYISPGAVKVVGNSLSGLEVWSVHVETATTFSWLGWPQIVDQGARPQTELGDNNDRRLH